MYVSYLINFIIFAKSDCKGKHFFINYKKIGLFFVKYSKIRVLLCTREIENENQESSFFW